MTVAGMADAGEFLEALTGVAAGWLRLVWLVWLASVSRGLRCS